MHMNICICDDDFATHQIIKEYLHGNLSSDVNVFDCFSAEDLLKSAENYDILFLDIKMGEVNGLEAAELIRKNNKDIIIIFISSYPNYVFKAFNVEALHFIVKPIDGKEFKSVLDRALYKYKTEHSSIKLNWQKERYVIKISSIKYIEGYNRHVTVYTQDGTYEALGKLSDLYKELAPHGFIRTHQGFIVNMDYIKRFDVSDVVLFDDTKIMISVRKKAEALEIFDKYLRNRKW